MRAQKHDGEEAVWLNQPLRESVKRGYERTRAGLTAAKATCGCIIKKISNLRLEANVWLALGTWVLAGVAIWGLRDNETALERSQRAWVVPVNEAIEDLTVDKSLKVNIEYGNVGKEPALHVGESNETWVTVKSKFDDVLDEIRNKWPLCKETKISVGANVVYPTTGGHSSQFHVNTALIVDNDLVNGDKIFVHYGCFAYETANSVHHSSFCFFCKAGYSNASNLNGCFTGNYAD
jgi:hypothetical protein